MEIRIMYAYEWRPEIPLDKRDCANCNDGFCQHFMDADKIYTRAEIETISRELGYSFFDRCGGDDCGHHWVAKTVVTKDGKTSVFDIKK